MSTDSEGSDSFDATTELLLTIKANVYFPFEDDRLRRQAQAHPYAVTVYSLENKRSTLEEAGLQVVRDEADLCWGYQTLLSIWQERIVVAEALLEDRSNDDLVNWFNELQAAWDEVMDRIGDLIEHLDEVSTKLGNIANDVDCDMIKQNVRTRFVRANATSFGEAVAEDTYRISNLDFGVCAVCQESYSEPVEMRCGHVFDMDCVIRSMLEKMKCPVCNKAAALTEIRLLKTI